MPSSYVLLIMFVYVVSHNKYRLDEKKRIKTKNLRQNNIKTSRTKKKKEKITDTHTHTNTNETNDGHAYHTSSSIVGHTVHKT